MFTDNEPRLAWLEGLTGSGFPNTPAKSVMTFQSSLHLVVEEESATAWNNLGYVAQRQGNFVDALSCYQTAVKIDPSLKVARRNLSTIQFYVGKTHEAIQYLREEIAQEDGQIWMRQLLGEAMACNNLSFASEYASVLAHLKWGSKWNSSAPTMKNIVPIAPPEGTVKVGKLEHDVEQFAYLARHGLLDQRFENIAHLYRRIIAKLKSLGKDYCDITELEEKNYLGEVYSRILCINHSSRLPHALSNAWKPAEVEDKYLENSPGIVVIDDFLTSEALKSLLTFCHGSTVWNRTNFAFGRIGSFFEDGFNCPLLVQIAEELRTAIPHILTSAYPLREIWGFKSGPTLSKNSTIHADFAAVNVNFWITPDEANLDSNSGGLVIYGVDAPIEWSWETYNGRLDLIKQYLTQKNATSMTIPYRQNRAIIFNSDLFHSTDELNFKEGFENKRLNITMLYGNRQNDQHYPTVRTVNSEHPGQMWRSKSFGRARH